METLPQAKSLDSGLILIQTDRKSLIKQMVWDAKPLKSLIKPTVSRIPWDKVWEAWAPAPAAKEKARGRRRAQEGR